jgi:MFS family permease
MNPPRSTPANLLLIAIALGGSNFLAVFDGLVVVVALPAVQQDFQVSTVDAQWLVTAYAIPLSGGMLVGGRLGDKFGRRRVLICGLAVFGLGSLVAALASGMAVLGLARVAQGLGATAAVPTSFALISALPNRQLRSRLFGLVATAGGIGAASGAVIGGLATDGFGWRAIFWLVTAISSVVLLSAHFGLKDTAVAAPSDSVQTSLGAPQAILSITALSLLVFGITNIERVGLDAPATIYALGSAALLFLAFVLSERRKHYGFARFDLLRFRSLRAAIAGIPGEEFAYQGALYLGLLFLQQTAGLSATWAGITFIPLGIAVLAGSAASTPLVRRCRWSWLTAGAVTGCAVGLGGLAISASLDGTPMLSLFTISLSIIGFCAAIAAVSLNEAAGSDVEHRSKGAAYGLHETALYLASAVVVAGLATIVEAMSPDGSSVPGTAFTVAFVIAATGALISAALVLWLGRLVSLSAKTSTS